jgi:methylphosphotriester-DNA--protein-cysteine methyltransferase
MNSSIQLAKPEGRPELMSAVAAGGSTAIDADRAWQQIVGRDPDATFFYAVTTTGVVCRPACKSRRPLRTNVRFFRNLEEATAAGFRPCLRCRPTSPSRGNPLDVVRTHIEKNLDRPVRLVELGRIAGLSPFTVQRLFKQAMGVSPLQYQRALKAGRLRAALKHGEAVTDAIYTAGFESSSRGYEGAQLGMTPARFARGGEGEEIRWAAGASPFGWVIVGETHRGLCWLSLAGSRAEAESIQIHRCRGWWMRRWRAFATGRTWRRAGLARSGWTCAERCSSCACGRHCARFPAARRAPTVSWPGNLASRRRPEP